MSIPVGERIDPLTDQELCDLAWARAFFNPPPRRVSDIYDDENLKEAFFAMWDKLPRLLGTVAERDERITKLAVTLRSIMDAYGDDEGASPEKMFDIAGAALKEMENAN